MKQNNPSYLFGMYEPDTDSVIVTCLSYPPAHLLITTAEEIVFYSP